MLFFIADRWLHFREHMKFFILHLKFMSMNLKIIKKKSQKPCFTLPKMKLWWSVLTIHHKIPFAFLGSLSILFTLAIGKKKNQNKNKRKSCSRTMDRICLGSVVDFLKCSHVTWSAMILHTLVNKKYWGSFNTIAIDK